MERGWSAEDDVAPVRLLRGVLRLWRRVGDGGSSPRPSVARLRPEGAEAAGMPARGRARRGADPDPFAYVRVAVDPREIHLD